MKKTRFAVSQSLTGFQGGTSRVMNHDSTNEDRSATNILLLDTTTLISILVMVVFIIKLFNNVIRTNSVGNLSTNANVGTGRRRKRSMFSRAPYQTSFKRKLFAPQFGRAPPSPPRPQFSVSTGNSEAQKLNRAVLSYDFIYLLIAIAATLLFVFETLYRVYSLYVTSNGRSSSLWSSLRKRKKRQVCEMSKTLEEDELCQKVMQLVSASHESL